MGSIFWPLSISMFPASLLAFWWSNTCIRPKMGFPEIFEGTIYSVRLVPSICPDGVSHLTHIHFPVPSLNFGPLVAKYLVEKLLAQIICCLVFTLMGWVSWPLLIFSFPSFNGGHLVAKYFTVNGVPYFFSTPWPCSGQKNARSVTTDWSYDLQIWTTNAFYHCKDPYLAVVFAQFIEARC